MKRFAHGRQLLEVLERAPDDLLHDLLADTKVESINALAALAADRPELEQDRSPRDRLIGRLGALPNDDVRPLRDCASDIVGMAAPRSAALLRHCACQELPTDRLEVFDLQPDEMARSLWAFLHARAMFLDAEAIAHARLFRDAGKFHDAFEIETAEAPDLGWSRDIQEKLVAHVTETLGLKETCGVTYLPAPVSDGEARQHILIIRHSRPLSSVAEMRPDGERGMHYYRPAGEATLTYTPASGRVEVWADTPGVRKSIAESFATAALDKDLSASPLALKQYDLSRFFDGSALPFAAVPEVDIERIAVVGIEVLPNNPRHRASLKVSFNDDLDAVAEHLFGDHNIFRRAAAISRVEIIVQYRRASFAKPRRLNITLRDPNRCNLNSNPDPDARDLGFQLLDQWGILKRFHALDAADEAALLPRMLELHDHPDDQITGRWLRTHGLDAEALTRAAFLERTGRDLEVLIDDDEGTLLEVHPQASGTPGMVRLSSHEDGPGVETPKSDFEKYSIKRTWLEERLIKRLSEELDEPELARMADDLWLLGHLIVDGARVPVMLARRLSVPKRLGALNESLRARATEGVGIVLAAGPCHCRHLGPNVVVDLPTHLIPSVDGPILDLSGVTGAFKAHRALARGGETVQLAISDVDRATLYIPGQNSLPLFGENQIKIVGRLVDAFHAGQPDVKTGRLMEGMRTRSVQDAFPNWKTIEGRYIRKGPRKGYWRLAA